ncbi:MAG: methionyl-tRNA formyltransferase [Bacteroidota bacterium]
MDSSFRNNKLRILFMGTPELAAVSLGRLLAADFEVIGVVTQPDRPKGRGMTLQPSPVKQMALQNGLEVWQPQQVDNEEFLAVYRRLRPDLVVVVAFGQKIPVEILNGPKYGCINVHGSLLPKYRGADPIRRALLNGDRVTGITTMHMNEGWDTGDIIFQEELEVGSDENYGSLYCRLAELGGKMLVQTIEALVAGKAPRVPQDDRLATKAFKVKPEQYRIDWNEPAEKIHNLVRALAPSPGAETYFNSERLKILETRMIDPSECNIIKDCGPGGILRIMKNEGLLIATGDRPLLITKMQPAGKRVMPANDCANGRCIKEGMRLCASPE